MASLQNIVDREGNQDRLMAVYCLKGSPPAATHGGRYSSWGPQIRRRHADVTGGLKLGERFVEHKIKVGKLGMWKKRRL